MTKPTQKKRSPSEVAEEKALAAELMLRKAALAYAQWPRGPRPIRAGVAAGARC